MAMETKCVLCGQRIRPLQDGAAEEVPKSAVSHGEMAGGKIGGWNQGIFSLMELWGLEPGYILPPSASR
jgi:hypothetical protein